MQAHCHSCRDELTPNGPNLFAIVLVHGKEMAAAEEKLDEFECIGPSFSHTTLKRITRNLPVLETDFLDWL